LLETGARVEDLSNKTKVKAYFKGGAEALIQVLMKNKRRLAEDASRRRFQESLRREFEDSKEILLPPHRPDRGDRPADRSGGLSALRPDRGGDCNRGGRMRAGGLQSIR